jgi:hypothetical protein
MKQVTSKEEKDKSLGAGKGKDTSSGVDKGKEKKKEPSHLEKEITKVQKMYDDLMLTIENNQPDFYSAAPASGGGDKHR